MSAAHDLFGTPGAAPSPVAAATIRAGADRERHALARLGLFGPEAERQAVAITRAKLRNAADLAEVQANPARCHFCGDVLDDTGPVVAVMTGRPRAVLWLHSGACHVAHSCRSADRVDDLMATAGFGSGPDTPTLHREDPAS